MAQAITHERGITKFPLSEYKVATCSCGWESKGASDATKSWRGHKRRATR